MAPIQGCILILWSPVSHCEECLLLDRLDPSMNQIGSLAIHGTVRIYLARASDQSSQPDLRLPTINVGQRPAEPDVRTQPTSGTPSTLVAADVEPARPRVVRRL